LYGEVSTISPFYFEYTVDGCVEIMSVLVSEPNTLRPWLSICVQLSNAS